MIIHPTLLSAKTLTALVESYVMREGTDYGDHIFTLEDKVQHINTQFERGEICITFDTNTESVNLLTRDQVREAGLSWEARPLELGQSG